MHATGLELHDVELFFSVVAIDGESIDLDMSSARCDLTDLA